MKSLIIGAALAAVSFAAVTPASAAADTKTHRPICLSIVRIDHTEVPNNRTILFYMQGGKIWKNTLPYTCPGLRLGAFSYSPTPSGNEICENVQMIKAVESGVVCGLGSFEPYTPPPKKTN